MPWFRWSPPSSEGCCEHDPPAANHRSVLPLPDKNRPDRRITMSTLLLRVSVGLHIAAMTLAERSRDGEKGQSTAEYALVLAGIAGLVALVFTQTDVFQAIFRKAVDVVNKAIK